ncbi:hypothetical protein FAES_4026 [Fibrella aestuarina BUZ 2]|uniref:Uncharacterized protein n=1 Tax=Fibrella aestuarina BUZ 2 TaxID=1166018 RepID=I0KD23_9BACT|nr:hypothetical protein [Fibrella aestuarina]CCH02026.1 hypothetical protein FAES_4026 [Fibrella aestuarina BUZ 2]
MTRFVLSVCGLLLASLTYAQVKVGGSASNAALTQKANLAGGNAWTGDQSVNGSFSQPFENVSLSVGNNRDVGFTKKIGSNGMLTYGLNNSLVIGQSSAADVGASNTFTQRLLLDNTGKLTLPTGGLDINGGLGIRLQADNSSVTLFNDNFGLIKKLGDPAGALAVSGTNPLRFVRLSGSTISGNVNSSTATELMQFNSANNMGVGMAGSTKYKVAINGSAIYQPYAFPATPTVSDVPSGSAVFGTVAGASNAGFFYNDGTTVRDLLAEKATARQVYYNTNVSGSLTIDASLYRDVFITLTGNVTSFSIINMTMGQSVYLRAEQGGTGGYTITFPTTLRFPGGADVDWHTTAGNANTFSFMPYSTTNADAFYTKQ